jgi:hypothetical protein
MLQMAEFWSPVTPPVILQIMTALLNHINSETRMATNKIFLFIGYIIGIILENKPHNVQ